jgi:hypothetical protein
MQFQREATVRLTSKTFRSVMESHTTKPAVVAELTTVKAYLTEGTNVRLVMTVPTIAEDAALKTKVDRAFAAMGWEPIIAGADQGRPNAPAP